MRQHEVGLSPTILNKVLTITFEKTHFIFR